MIKHLQNVQISYDPASTHTSIRDTNSSVSLKSEFLAQFKTAWPTLACLLLYRCPWIISLRFVGDMGATQMAAASLASTLCNVMGMSLSVGLSSALTTLTGQARGHLLKKIHQQEERDHASAMSIQQVQSTRSALLLPLVYLYRGILVQLCIIFPMGLWWIFGNVSATLQALGQTEELAIGTAEYLRILAPGLWSYSLHWHFVSWLQVLQLAYVPAWCALIGVILHIPTNYLFAYTLGMGSLGVAWATTTFQAIQPCLIMSYIYFYGPGTRRVLDHMGAAAVGRTSLSLWPELCAAASSWSGLFQYLSLALPGIGLMSEWWASEVVVFWAGRLRPSSNLALSAMALYQSINAVCFMFPMSWSVAGAARVSQALGAGDGGRARTSGWMCVNMAAIVSGSLGILLYVFPHTMVPRWFAPNEPLVVAEAAKTIPALAAYVLGDGIQAALTGLVKGIGQQCKTLPIVVFAYWFVALPLVYYNVFMIHDSVMVCTAKDSAATFYPCGVEGLVAGMTLGTWIHAIGLGLIVFCCMDWHREAEKAQARVRLEQTDNSEDDDDDVGNFGNGSVGKGARVGSAYKGRDMSSSETRPLAYDDEYAQSIEMT
jgi:multidrug resistance protein, MATE family